MRRPRLRITIRWMMVAVALVAIGLSVQAVRRRSTFRDGIDFHAEQERRAIYLIGLVDASIREDQAAGFQPSKSDLADLAHYKRLAELHGGLKKDYEKAEKFPLGPAPSDPVPPRELD